MILYFVELNWRFMFYALLVLVNTREMFGLLRTRTWNALWTVVGKQERPQGFPLADIILFSPYF